MRLSSLLRSAALLAGGFCSAALRADSSSSRHPASAPNPEIVALKDSITALASGPIHELTDSETKANTRLDALEQQIKRLSTTLDAADLGKWGRDQAAAKSAVSDLVGKSDALDQAMQELGGRLDASDAATARSDRELKAALNLSTNQLLALTQSAQEWQQLWPRQLAAQSRAFADQERQHWEDGQWIAEIAGGSLLVLIISGWALQGRTRRRQQREVIQSIGRLQAEMRQSIALVGATRAPAGGANWEAIENRLYQLAQRWESAAVAADPLSIRTTHRTRSSAPMATLSPSEKPTISVGALPEPTVASRLLWPAEFLDPESPLSRWRFLLESHFDDEEHPALPVLAALLALRMAVERPAATSAEIAAGVFRLSETLHAYWQSLTDLSADDRQQASAAWIRSVRQLVAPSAPRMELREIMPGSRVDPDLMHATAEGPGNHLNVAEVHSWAVIDRSGDRPKVLHRAQIASS